MILRILWNCIDMGSMIQATLCRNERGGCFDWHSGGDSSAIDLSINRRVGRQKGVALLPTARIGNRAAFDPAYNRTGDRTDLSVALAPLAQASLLGCSAAIR